MFSEFISLEVLFSRLSLELNQNKLQKFNFISEVSLQFKFRRKYFALKILTYFGRICGVYHSIRKLQCWRCRRHWSCPGYSIRCAIKSDPAWQTAAIRLSECWGCCWRRYRSRTAYCIRACWPWTHRCNCNWIEYIRIAWYCERYINFRLLETIVVIFSSR